MEYPLQREFLMVPHLILEIISDEKHEAELLDENILPILPYRWGTPSGGRCLRQILPPPQVPMVPPFPIPQVLAVGTFGTEGACPQRGYPIRTYLWYGGGNSIQRYRPPLQLIHSAVGTFGEGVQGLISDLQPQGQQLFVAQVHLHIRYNKQRRKNKEFLHL